MKELELRFQRELQQFLQAEEEKWRKLNQIAEVAMPFIRGALRRIAKTEAEAFFRRKP